MVVMRLTQVERVTATLQKLLAHLEALAEMGAPVHIPAELADSCRKMVRLAEAGEADPLDRPSDAVARSSQGPLPSDTPGRHPSRIRDAVLAVIQPGEDVTVKVVADRLEAAGVAANRNTVSNELSEWTRQGKLERPERGTYRLDTTTITDHAHDNGPLAAGERPADQEKEVGGDAATRTEGAVM